MTEATPLSTRRVIRSPFQSFFMGGFECSTHVTRAGRRLDLIDATDHDRQALSDYRQVRRHGISTARDGVRWHRIEASPGHYDFSSFLAMLRAARAADVQVIWDLLHFGWPDHIDVWSARFVDRFAAFCTAVATLVAAESDEVPFYCPVNEISFVAWAGGDTGHINPHATGRGDELKRQLVRAAIAGIDAIRAVEPRARFISAEPVIHIEPRFDRPDERPLVEGYLRAQWDALNFLSGRLCPELGGSSDYLDLVGVNFYPNNQWVHEGGQIPFGRHDYRPFREFLKEAHERFGRPVFVAETGAEGSAAPAWLHYVCDEVRAAEEGGTPVLGICVYPVLDYPGWDNERECHVGLLKRACVPGGRAQNVPLVDELTRQMAIRQSAAAQRRSDAMRGAKVTGRARR